MTDLLQIAIDIARRAHAGQVDKGGAPYIEHPLRVMAALDDPETKIAGVLHDVVEDSDITLADLREAGLPETSVAAVEALTKRSGEAYEAYLARVMANRMALRVKIADMTDNSDLSRLPSPTEKDLRRHDKYQRILPRLRAALHDG